jgi:hypothetical protein
MAIFLQKLKRFVFRNALVRGKHGTQFFSRDFLISNDKERKAAHNFNETQENSVDIKL